MSLVAKLKERVSSLKTTKTQTALESYREMLARQDAPKPTDEEKILEVCQDLGIDFDRIDVHTDALNAIIKLDEAEKSVRKLASTESAKRSQYEAVKVEVQRIIADAKQRLYEATIELESAFRAAERVRDIVELRSRIESEFSWLIAGRGADTPTADQARQLCERVAILANVAALTVAPGQELRACGRELGSSLPYI